MMLAAADAAEGRGSPPPELTLAQQARAWGALPRAGGLLDQPAGLLGKMTAALNVYEAVRMWKATPADKVGEFIQRSPDAWALVERVRKLRGGNA